MKRVESEKQSKQPGRVLGRVLAEELEEVRGGFAPIVGATAGQTVSSNGHLDLTGGRPEQTDGD
jgi:hypothetical protein